MLVPPNPPSPPRPPPSPPSPPPSPSPPPVVAFTRRAALEERAWDPDCEPVTYDECRLVQEAHSKVHPDSPYRVQATLALCEGVDTEEHCFRCKPCFKP